MLIFLAVALLPSPALAHKVNVFASVEGHAIRGKVYFRGGGAAQDATVTAFDSHAEEIGKATTDEQGQFTLEARFRCDHRLLAEVGDGHGGEFTVTAAQLPADLPLRGQPPPAAPAKETASSAATPHGLPASSGTPAAMPDQLEALREEIVCLREQLGQYEDRLRFRDVLGGIGYIVGITGIVFYCLGLLRKGQHG